MLKTTGLSESSTFKKLGVGNNEIIRFDNGGNNSLFNQ